MPPLSHLKTHIKFELAVVGVVIAMAAGIGGWIGRSQVSSLPPSATATVIEGVAARTTRMNPFSLARLRGWTAADQTPSLVVPPPVIPQPLAPQSAWPPPPQASTAPLFTDVPIDHWINPKLTDLATRQLVAGFPDGSFRPAAAMTRAEFAAQLAQLFDLALLANQAEPTPYPDVTTDHWAHQSIQRALQMGFLTGYPDQTFKPDQTITRLQVIVALANGLSLRSSRHPDSVLKPYQDAQQMPAWAKKLLVSALDVGLIAAYPETNKLDLQRLASRAEVVAILHQALVYTGSLSPLPAQLSEQLSQQAAPATPTPAVN